MSNHTDNRDHIRERLSADARRIMDPENHLRNLVKAPGRFGTFSRSGAGFLFDFSRQRLDIKVLDLLLSLVDARGIGQHFTNMASGETVNTTEGRAALHTASRSFADDPLHVADADVMSPILRERERVKRFSADIRAGRITGSSGKPFAHVVVVGIGGSYLGTEFVYNGLQSAGNRHLRLHFLTSVDTHEFAGVIARVDPETTLWIVISKSYTTSETLANEKQARSYMESRDLDPRQHFVAVTGKGSPGDDPENPVLKTFHMFDFIGGRYSVTSAVGGVPLSIVYGYEVFERFLRGAGEMDCHALVADAGDNLPLLAALISHWNYRYLGYRAQAIVPYASLLSKLAPHIQQLHMESNGKSAGVDGQGSDEPAGYIVFGEPGTNAQHSFFQLAHQSQPFPIDFIGVIRPYGGGECLSKGVTPHQELWSNMVAQAAALAGGKTDDNPATHFPGNRPSSTLLMEDLSPENIGRLLSFYEAKTVFEGFLWGINPFDQFGVELGKTTADGIRQEIAERNRQPDHRFDTQDPITRAYLDILLDGKRPT